MSLNNYIRISALSLICFLSSMPSASAQWPTLDMSAIGQDLKSIQQQVEQYKTQLMESKTVGSINSAIGDAKSSMSKFSTGDLEAAKKKAEKAKKKAEKIKKIQDDIKKAKEEYEEKKKQYEEYKQQLDEAKEMANDVKDIASSAGDLAGQAVSDVKGKVSSATGVDLPSSSSSGAASSSGTVSSVASVSASQNMSANNATSTVSSMQSVAKSISANASQTAVSRASVTPSSAGVVSSVQGGAAVKFQGTASSLQPVGGTVSANTLTGVSGLNAATPLQTSEAGALVMSDGLTEKTAVSAVKGRTAFTGVEIAGENELSSTDAEADFTALKSRISDAKVSIGKAGAAANEVKDSVNKAKEIAASQGSVAGVSSLKNTLSQAVAKGDVQTMNAVAKVNTADIITSDSKVYQPATTAVKDLSSLKSNVQSSVSQVKASVNQAKEAVSSQKTIGRKAFTTPSAVSGSINGSTELKAAPQLRGKESSLWLEDEIGNGYRSVKLAYADTLAYGSAECEYQNFIVSGDDGEIVLVPKTLAKECCLKAEELEDMNVIKDCAGKLLSEMNNSDNTIAAEARGMFDQIVVEQSLYGLAESLDNTNASTSYLSDVLEQYKEDMKAASTTGDDISTIAMTNTQLLYLLNRIRRIYTSSLAATGISSLNGVEAKTLSEDTDIGVSATDSEYEFSVTRNDVEYPVIPENMAKKCIIQFSSVDKVKECYIDAVRNMHASDFKDAEIGTNYVNNITYQNILDILAKSLYQRVKSAKYDEQLEKTKETNADATTVRTKSDGLFNTDYEIQEALDDIVNMLASRVAHSGLTSLGKLNPLSTEG